MQTHTLTQKFTNTLYYYSRLLNSKIQQGFPTFARAMRDSFASRAQTAKLLYEGNITSWQLRAPYWAKSLDWEKDEKNCNFLIFSKIFDNANLSIAPNHIETRISVVFKSFHKTYIMQLFYTRNGVFLL